MRARHTRFNRIATTVVAGFAFAAATAGGAVLVLHNEGVINMHNDVVNKYRSEFYVDDSLVYETLTDRGEVIGYGYEDFPAKDCDVDGQLYIFSGWDLTGEGIPDILPYRSYSNFKAQAVFAKFGIPNIDWSEVDFNKLLDLLNYLNIDLESFMNFFGLDWEDMLELLDIPIINYTTDYRGLIYLRSESFGDYNTKKHKWNNANYYPASNISEGSVNPLEYTVDKAYSVFGEEANTTVDLEYLKSGNNYPVICYEKGNEEGLNSEAISLTSPFDNKYTSTGLPYSYVTSDIINMLRMIPYSSKAISADEEKYREYVNEHYLKISDEYQEIILDLLSEYGITYDNNYRFVDKINNFFKKNYEFNFQMPSYPMTIDPPMYFLTDAKVGIGRHFAAATTLIYRALGVPARYVQGYVDYAEDDENTIAAIQAHSWCEIYIDGVGWVATDTALQSISDTDLGFLFNTENIDELDFEAPAEGELQSIDGRMKNDSYNIGDTITVDDIVCHANYSSGDRVTIKPDYIVPPDMNSGGDKVVKVFYHDGDVVCMTEIPIHVEGGLIKCKIKLIPDEIEETTYNGNAPYYGNDLFILTDDKGVPIALNEGDTVEFYPVFTDPTIMIGSFMEIKDAGDYTFRVRAEIYDINGNDVTTSSYQITNNYSPSSKLYRISIFPATVALFSASQTITQSEIPPSGIYTYPYLSGATSSYSNTRLNLYGGDFIFVTDLPWAGISSVGTVDNTFGSVDDITVYRETEYGLENKTSNYILSIGKVGQLVVQADEVD